MANTTFLHLEDASIVRSAELTTLYDADGNNIWQFPPEWSNEQIMHAVALANSAYESGYEIGKVTKARQIREALNID